MRANLSGETANKGFRMFGVMPRLSHLRYEQHGEVARRMDDRRVRNSSASWGRRKCATDGGNGPRRTEMRYFFYLTFFHFLVTAPRGLRLSLRPSSGAEVPAVAWVSSHFQDTISLIHSRA